MGPEGLKKASQVAILNANYICKKLLPHYKVLYRDEKSLVAHEFILDVREFKETANIEVADIAKRLMDYGKYDIPALPFRFCLVLKLKNFSAIKFFIIIFWLTEKCITIFRKVSLSRCRFATSLKIYEKFKIKWDFSQSSGSKTLPQKRTINYAILKMEFDESCRWHERFLWSLIDHSCRFHQAGSTFGLLSTSYVDNTQGTWVIHTKSAFFGNQYIPQHWNHSSIFFS